MMKRVTCTMLTAVAAVVSFAAVIADDLDLGFDNLDYRVKTLTIPFKSMKRNNTVEISQLNQGTNMNGTPWLAINYVIVSPHGKK